MSCPDPYRPYNPIEPAPDLDAELHKRLPSDADVRSLASALAANGGGASSEDLALDLVLNQIVEQACLATGATGAAIALTRNGEMVCRATTGSTAPDLGVRLDNAGFSAECLRVGMLQRCDDTETDPRVDAAACRLLGVRSILVVPLWYWGEFMGIFEIFSPRPSAFGERDEQTLQALAYRIVRHTKQANGQLTGFASDAEETAPLQVPATEPAAPKSRQLETRKLEPRDLAGEEEATDLEQTKPLRESARDRIRAAIFELKPPAAKPAPAGSDPVTKLFAAFAAVIACLILGLMIYRIIIPVPAQRAMLPPAAPQTQELDLGPLAESPAPSLATTALAATPQSSQSSQPLKQGASKDSSNAAEVVVPAASKKKLGVPAPAPAEGGGLAIYDEKGKLIYGSPIRSADDTATPKPKKAKTAGKPANEASNAGGATGVSPVGTLVKSAAARTKANDADKAAAPDSTANSSALNLTEGRYVRLKPDLAESLLDERVEPDYPDAARRAHVQGSVILETLIGANGKVQEVAPVSGPPQLAEAAANAVRQWKYKPFTVDGQKVPIRTQVTVTFMLAQ